MKEPSTRKKWCKTCETFEIMLWFNWAMRFIGFWWRVFCARSKAAHKALQMIAAKNRKLWVFSHRAEIRNRIKCENTFPSHRTIPLPTDKFTWKSLTGCLKYSWCTYMSSWGLSRLILLDELCFYTSLVVNEWTRLVTIVKARWQRSKPSPIRTNLINHFLLILPHADAPSAWLRSSSSARVLLSCLLFDSKTLFMRKFQNSRLGELQFLFTFSIYAASNRGGRGWKLKLITDFFIFIILFALL